jgi:inosose dehydratase
MDKVDVGYHCLTWGAAGFLKALTEISELGYKGIETFGTLVDEWETKLSEFQSLMAQKKLRLASLYCSGAMTNAAGAKKEIETAVRCARFIKANGGDVVVLGGGRPQEGQRLDEAWKVFIATTEEIGRRCQDFGVRAAYHPHRGTLVETREQLARLMENSNRDLLFFAPDTGHLKIGGVYPEEVFRAYIDRIIYVHYKDVRVGPPVGSPPLLFAEIGEGAVNFRAVTKVLRNHSYNGWIIIELDRSTRTPKESAAISKRHMAEVLGFEMWGAAGNPVEKGAAT